MEARRRHPTAVPPPPPFRTTFRADTPRDVVEQSMACCQPDWGRSRCQCQSWAVSSQRSTPRQRGGDANWGRCCCCYAARSVVARARGGAAWPPRWAQRTGQLACSLLVCLKACVPPPRARALLMLELGWWADTGRLGGATTAAIAGGGAEERYGTVPPTVSHHGALAIAASGCNAPILKGGACSWNTEARGLRVSTKAQGLRVITETRGFRVDTKARRLRVITEARRLRVARQERARQARACR
jgi:hypothetical protein